MMIILILTSLWWSSWSSPAWSPLSSSWFRCYMSTGQTAGLLWVWRWSLIFPSVEALREPALNTLVLFPPNNLCNFGVSSVFFVVHDFGLKEKFLERQIFLIRIFLIWIILIFCFPWPPFRQTTNKTLTQYFILCTTCFDRPALITCVIQLGRIHIHKKWKWILSLILDNKKVKVKVCTNDQSPPKSF